MSPVAIACTGPREIGLVYEEEPALGDEDIRVRTLYSGISAGTELTLYRDTNPYLHKKWDRNRRLFMPDPQHGSTQYPVLDWGYEEVGEIEEVGANVPDLSPGTVIYGTWGHRSGTVLPAEDARRRILSSNLDPILGIFSHIAAIALNGVLDSAVRLGETVAVFGLGVVGQLVAQLARLSGADVVGVEPIAARQVIARLLGTATVVDPREFSPAEYIKDLTGGRGADICVEASGSPQVLHEAIRACAYSSRVVSLGFFQGHASGLALGDEFHHNRIALICSQISGLAPDLQHRWGRQRLMQTAMRLIEEDRLQVRPLITHIVAASEAASLFKLLDQRPAEAMQAVLDFRGELTP